jgi:CheY-like chemotaxis protein
LAKKTKNPQMKNKLNCILLVDDDEPTNFLNKMILEDVNCAKNIQVADSGQSALSYLETATHDNDASSPDLIFLDINMPAMNGWEFLERYTNLEKQHKANVVIVMLTTSLNPDDRAKASKIPDVSGFETKPLTLEKLQGILKKYFPATAVNI